MKCMIIYFEKDFYNKIKENNIFAKIVQKIGSLGYKEQHFDGGIYWNVCLPKNDNAVSYMLNVFRSFGRVEVA